MADEYEPPVGPPAPGGGAPRRWLRWGRVLVDIEPPQGPNPWTSAPPGAPAVEVPLTGAAPAPRRWRLVAMFGLAALAGALLTSLLILLFGRHDARRPVLAPVPVTTTTTRPPAGQRPVTTTSPSSPTSGPGGSTSIPGGPSTTTAGGPSSAPTTAPTGGAGSTVVGGGRSGGPITIPEGIDPSSTTAPSTPPTTAPRPAPAPATTTTNPQAQAFLGVTVQDAVDGPSVVDILAGTGAERAGILPGDVILSVDAATVATVDDLGVAITSHRPGDTVTVHLLRNGASVSVKATLGTKP